jgi:Ca2+-binding EF-hand superfamily protein/Ran GTPase-activating protein (RanGAP) involved in mRNA processing and transport
VSIIPDLAYDEILAVIDMFDPNHDGEIQYVEFAHTFYNCEINDNKVKARKAMIRIRRMASTKKGFNLREAFRRFDKDGDGSVSHDELKVVINDILQGDISEEEMQAVIEMFDPNNDGDIQYGEFRNVFYSISVDQEKSRNVCDHTNKNVSDEFVEMNIIPPLMRDEYSSLLLSHNNITDAGAEEIAGAIKDDKSHVSTIDLRNNKITEAGAKLLGEALMSNVYVAELYLSHNDIGGTGAAAIAESFAPTSGGFCAIFTIDLRSCGIDDAGAETMAKFMAGNTTLKYISLCANAIGDNGATALSQALQSERCKMYSVNLAHNKIGGRGGKMIGYSLKCNKELKEIVLSGNKIGDLGVSAFAESLEGVEEMDESEGLESHAMMDTGSGKQRKKQGQVPTSIADEAKKKKAVAKPLQCGLRLLGLSGCGITDNGMGDLGGSLRTNRVLSTLDIRCNEVTDDGIVGLARSLEENTQLRELYCGDNAFGASACVAIGSALSRNVSLLTLDISGCDLSKPKGAESIAEGLSKNGSLHELNVARTKLTDEGMQAFAVAVETNVCLERLIFHCNLLSKKCIAAVEYAMSRERTQAAKLLDDMEDARLKRRQEMKEREMARRIKAAQEAKEKRGGGEGEDVDLSAVVEKKAMEVLEPGTKIWIPVSFGRRNNVLGKIEVESTTTLLDARGKIENFGDLGDEFVFLSISDGKPIDVEEEGKRQVTWDCGRHVMLKPQNWIEL